MNDRRTAFTLVELLVVITIIGLLLTMLMPSLGKARELTRRAVCRTNLDAVGNAMAMYATDHMGLLPVVACKPNLAYNKIGHNRTLVEGPTADIEDNSRTMYKLIHAGWTTTNVRDSAVETEMVTVEGFVCPSVQQDTPDPLMDDPQYSFSSWRHVSYSFQVQRADAPGALTTQAQASDKAIMADRNPLFRWDNSTSTDFSNMVPSGKPIGSNSTNHNEEGQAVLYLDGHAAWAPSSACGSAGDNIYARMDADGNAVAPTGSDRPRDQDDSLLGP